MRFVPGPPTVLEVPLNIGFVGKSEQTGHPAQKPLSVIKPLLLMTTKQDDLVLDPMCGSGTTGEACLQLNRRAILCDESEQWVGETRERVQRCQVDVEANLLAWSAGGPTGTLLLRAHSNAIQMRKDDDYGVWNSCKPPYTDLKGG